LDEPIRKGKKRSQRDNMMVVKRSVLREADQGKMAMVFGNRLAPLIFLAQKEQKKKA
jgi:hypothetical protein